jgi:hypothetical protein
MTDKIVDHHYLTYNLFLDSEIDYNKLDNLKILNIKENLPLTDALLEYIIKNNVKFIEFMPLFNQSINILPECVEHIYFPSISKFNQPLDNLPSNLKSLIIGSDFSYNLNNLPHSLLYLGYHRPFVHIKEQYPNERSWIIQEIIGDLPARLKYISLGVGFYNAINWHASIYNKNIKFIKNGESFPSRFINLIEDRYNLDYFIAVM